MRIRKNTYHATGRKIFLDVGSNMGMGFAECAPIWDVDSTWEIFAFEANPHSIKYYQENIESNRYDVLKDKKITLINKAVWDEDEDGELPFRPEKVSETYYNKDKKWAAWCDNLNEGYKLGNNLDFIDFNIPTTGGSLPGVLYDKLSDKKKYAENLVYEEAILVECIDFSQWVKESFSKNDYIIMKMDIEGFEYKVLPKMIKDNTIQYVDELIIEWHNGMVLGYEDLDAKLKKEIRDLGVVVQDWY